MSDNKILITIELTPDDELVARNAVTGDELARRVVDYHYRPERAYSVAQVIDAIRVELRSLIVDEDEATSERYT